MSDTPAITVVIPSYRRGGDVIQLLKDLLDQRHPAEEVLLIDQQPVHPPEVEQELGAICDGRRIRRIVLEKANAQAARNRGILEAKGEVLIFVDDDTRVGPEFIDAHRGNYGEDPELDGVSGQVLLPGQSTTSEKGPECGWPHNGWMFFPMNYDRRAPTANWPSCNASIRRSVALKAGGFDEQFERTWFDDSDFSWRLHLAGAKIVFDPRASLLHLKTASGGNRPARRDEWVWADEDYWATMFYFWRKNFGVTRVWRHVWWYVRHFILRKKLLLRPGMFLRNWMVLARGWARASKKLAEGPKLLSVR